MRTSLSWTLSLACTLDIASEIAVSWHRRMGWFTFPNRRPGLRIALVAALVSVVLGGPGCIGATVSEHGPGFVEIETEHFRLVSDLAPTIALNLAEALEWLRPVAEWAVGVSPQPLAISTTMVVLHDRGLYEALAPAATWGLFSQSPSSQWILVSAHRSIPEAFQVAAHEYVHLMLASQPEVAMPLWLEEGIAMLLSDLHFKDDDVRIGYRPFWLARVWKSQMIPFRDLMEVGTSSRLYGNHDDAWA